MQSARDMNVLSQSSRDVLCHLWDGLQAMALIQNVSTEAALRSIPNNQASSGSGKTRQQPWHRFLNEMSHLCQFHNAGEVISIGAEDNKQGATIFWLALNKGALSTPTEHLEWILETIQELPVPSSPSFNRTLEHVAKTIATATIKRSPQRVGNYYHILRKIISDINDQLDMKNGDECNLQAELQRVRDSSEDYTVLCERAYNFRKLPASKTLDTKCVHPTDDWSRARHLLGRLGSWHKAARFISAHAPHFRTALRGSTVEAIPYNGPALSIPIRPTVDDLLGRVCPTYRETIPLKTARIKMATARNVLQLWQKKPQIPVVHSEAAMLHHFQSAKRKFVNNDQYIGSSKPSCYACSLYFEQFPNIVKRPSHGRAWLHWYPPSEEGTASLDTRTIDMLRRMADRMQNDVVNHITLNTFGSNRRWDSTTGMSPSFVMAMDGMVL